MTTEFEDKDGNCRWCGYHTTARDPHPAAHAADCLVTEVRDLRASLMKHEEPEWFPNEGDRQWWREKFSQRCAQHPKADHELQCLECLAEQETEVRDLRARDWDRGGLPNTPNKAERGANAAHGPNEGERHGHTTTAAEDMKPESPRAGGTQAAPVEDAPVPAQVTAGICAKCGGPHRFDTSVPSVAWNRVIRPRGHPDYLCTTCIVEAFAEAGESFTATLYGERVSWVKLLIEVNGCSANDAHDIQEENNALRWKLRESEAHRAAQTAALREYGQHKPGCTLNPYERTADEIGHWASGCTCGLADELDRLSVSPALPEPVKP